MRKKKAISDATRRVDHLPGTTPNRKSSIVSKKANNQQGSENNNRDLNAENNRASSTVKKAGKEAENRRKLLSHRNSIRSNCKNTTGRTVFKKGSTHQIQEKRWLHFLFEITSNYRLIWSKENWPTLHECHGSAGSNGGTKCTCIR